MKRLLVFVLLIALTALFAYALSEGQYFQVTDISNCVNLTIGVSDSEYSSGEIIAGEYDITNCTQSSPNFWMCNCDESHNFQIWMSTTGKTIYDYNFRIDKTEAVPTGSPNLTTALFSTVCFTDWSECADNTQFRLCQGIDGTNVTKVRGCFPVNATNVTNPSCTENWVCGNWSGCENGTVSRSCTDTNNCPNPGSRPVMAQSCTDYNNTGCVEDWVCDVWGSCENGTVSRSCTDVNNCTNPGSRPIMTKPCANWTYTGCVEDWVCSEWGSCNGTFISRNCTDANSCIPRTSRPLLTQSCMIVCAENWTCQNWTSCINGFHTRSCIDSNNCGTIIEQPTTSQECSSCTEKWSCTDWSVCRIGNKKTRSCTDSSKCGTTLSKPSESLNCTYSGGGGGGNGGGGNGGGNGGNPSSSNGTDSTNGWKCDPYGPCINGRHSAICYRDTPDSGLSYKVTEDCADDAAGKANSSVVIVNSTEPVNETQQGQITGNVVVVPSGGRSLWPPVLSLFLLALLAGGYILGRNNGWFGAAGKKKAKK